MSQYLVLAEAVLEMKRIFALHLVSTHEDGTASAVDCYLDAASASAPITSLRLEGQDAKLLWDHVVQADEQLHITRFYNWALDLSRVCVVRYHTRKAEVTFAFEGHSYVVMIETPRAMQEMRNYKWAQAETAPAAPEPVAG